MLVPIEQLDESVARFEQESVAKAEETINAPLTGVEKAIIDEFVADSEPAPSGASLTVEENLEKRKEMLAELRQEPVEFAYERAIGRNDSVYSNFCELIILAKRKVGRIVVKDGIRQIGSATGFMVSDRLLLTNWHVFRGIEEVQQSEVEFFYELDIFGRRTSPTSFRLAPQDFFFSLKDLDYCLVAVDPMDVSGKTELSTIGYHYLDPTLGKLGEEGKEKMNIIHHPGGDYQQLSIRDNTYVKILEKTIWYSSDTAQGSSGSPVFNDQWQVVALHHMGVPKRTADGKNYADKDGNPVLPVGKKIDETKIHWIANEGIRISVLLKDLFERFPDDQLVLGMKRKRDPSALPTPDANAALVPATPKFTPRTIKETEIEDKPMSADNSDNVQIAFPASLIETNGNITISINNRFSAVPAAETARGPIDQQQLVDEALLEAKKTDLENSIDYSDCQGYQEDFLGIPIPLPKPKKALRKFVAPLKTGSRPVLDYYFYSTIQHSVRKMPIISAINVDGNLANRKDETKRVDVWLRDNRMDYEMQLDDKFYKASKFDRGHMSRREDANYGPTPELARKFADMTCIYTNACPQVPGLNRSNKQGIWGKLEKAILEKGVNAENGKSTSITVFNGPIFDDDDRFFRGIQIPMEFWKIVLWFNEKGKLRATGFKLSQADLVGEIDFEKLGFDTDSAFVEQRCSISSLEKLTNIDFSGIKPLDTFRASDGSEFVRIESEESLRNLIEESFKSE
jgi:endonuclease G, mitochondrial